MSKRLLIIFLCCAWGDWLFAQDDLTRLIDSVSTALQTTKEDTNKVILLSELSYRLRNVNADTALKLAQQELQLAEKLNFKKGKAQALHDLAGGYLYTDEYIKALEQCNLAYEMMKDTQKADEKFVLGMILNTFGRIYLRQANYPKALYYLLDGLKVREQTNDKLGIAQSYNYIATVYYNQSNHEQALIYHFKALKNREEANDKQGMAQSYNNIGAVYRQLKDYPQALEYNFKALKIDEELGNQYGIAYDLTNIANVYIKQKELQKALDFHFKALKIREEINDYQSIVYGLNRIAQIYQQLNNLSTSNQYATRAYKMAKEANFARDIQDASLILAANYDKQKNIPQAYYFQTIAIRLKDSIFNIEKEKEVANIQANYDLEKKQDEIDILSRDKIISEEKLEISKLYRYFYIGGLLFLGFVAFMLIRNNRKAHKVNLLLNEQKRQIDERNEELQATLQLTESQKKEIDESNEELKQTNEELQATLDLAEEQKREIEKKNEDITDSIIYAKRIQTAMLPVEEIMNSSLGKDNFFILYKPRDIVSGDFYWFAEVAQEEKRTSEGINLKKTTSKIVFAVVDCTGHGVPGAFMSMIGNELLNEIVIEKNITSPDLILNQLHKGIRYALKQDQNQSKDGMDVSICTIDKARGILEYAGANNPLYLIQNGNLQDIKADKISIGGEHRGVERIFTKHSFQLPISTTPQTYEGKLSKSETTLYLFTDGFQDQFGGKDDKKFMVKHFRNLLHTIHQDSMPIQAQILNKTISDWIGRGRQTDDITVVGIRV
jgi:serine phosphatase RsbU (regulator of sigma subunit)